MRNHVGDMIVILVVMWQTVSGLVVDRRKEKLDRVPSNIDADVTILILRGNKIKRIEDNSVGHLFVLEELDLKNNGVNFISEKAFSNNSYLSVLEIQGHSLLAIPPGLGGASKSITRVILAISQVHMLTVDFTNYPVLERLAMNFAPTNTLILRELPSLREVFAQDCNLQIFPNLTGAPELELVQLQRNMFSQIPQTAITGLSRLRRLVLSFCRVTHLPDLSYLISLEELIVHGNSLSTMPDMFHLPLTTITLANNPLACDRKLCWIRMWDFVKSSPLNTVRSQLGVCARPAHFKGMLMDVHPVDLKCYEGTCV